MRMTFVSDELDGMHSGTVELSVPLIGGVIQIGAPVEAVDRCRGPGGLVRGRTGECH
jgi:hypothetical protein